MGLGKTVQALALLMLRRGLGPALVVAPTSVGFNWVRECARFAPTLRVRTLRGKVELEALQGLAGGDLLITSWDMVARHPEAFQAQPFATRSDR